MGLQTGQGDVRVHSGSLWLGANAGCLRLPLFGPAPKVHVLAQGLPSCGSGCPAGSVGSSNVSLPSGPPSPEGDQEDQGPGDQGHLGVSTVAHGPVVGLLLDLVVEPPMVLPHFRTILETQDGSPVIPYLDPLVALHVSGRSSS